MAEFSNDPVAGELLLLLLCNNIAFADVAAVVEELKNNSKGAGSHKRRQLYWDGYGSMINKTTSLDGLAHCFITYRASGEEGVEGQVEIVDLTKRQKGMVGSVDIMGTLCHCQRIDSASQSCYLSLSSTTVSRDTI